MATYLNRRAIVVRYKERFVAWARSLEADPPLDYLRTTATVFLAEQHDDYTADEVLELYWPDVFEEQLAGCRLEHTWPQERTFELFKAWFGAEVIDAVIDLSEEPLELD